ncbi:MAG: LapA family protein [Actinomycetota bacterium]
MNDKKSSAESGRRLSVRQVGWALLAVVAVLFVVLNNDKAEINLIAASPEWPMWVLVIASMVIGFLLAKLTGWRRRDD